MSSRIRTVPPSIPREESQKILNQILRDRIPLVRFIKKHQPIHLRDLINAVGREQPAGIDPRYVKQDVWAMVEQWDGGPGAGCLRFDDRWKISVHPEYQDSWLCG